MSICDQCVVLNINGLNCHETGCPNMPRECKECGESFPRWEITSLGMCGCCYEEKCSFDDSNLEDEYNGEYNG